MTDKVQKIREEVEKLKSQLLRGACSSQIAMETRCKEEAYNEVLAILDSLQEEPKFKVGDTIRLKNDGLEAKITSIDESGFVYAACEDWEQIIDPSKWEIVHRTKTDVDAAMAEIEEKSKAFTEANKGKTSEEILAEMRGEEPVSEDLGKVGSLKSLEYYPEKKTTNKTSKGVFDANMPRRKAYLRGFKDGAHAHKELIANKPVSEDLGEYIDKLSKQFPEVSFAKLSRIAVRVAKWKEQQLMANAVEGVVHHFEKCGVASVHYNDPTGVPMAYFTSPEGLSAGDKVKIIVIKED